MDGSILLPTFVASVFVSSTLFSSDWTGWACVSFEEAIFSTSCFGFSTTSGTMTEPLVCSIQQKWNPVYHPQPHYLWVLVEVHFQFFSIFLIDIRNSLEYWMIFIVKQDKQLIKCTYSVAKTSIGLQTKIYFQQTIVFTWNICLDKKK